jgi:NADPH:quinone reductase-like Zn-dependent oxidoreductase
MIFGASGGVGHFAIQLAKQIGARVFAVASGADGVALSKRLGADVAVDGRRADVLAEARKFADGLDAALLTAGGSAAENALLALRDGGRVAYPNGVKPKPGPRSGVTTQSFDAIRGASAIERLHRLIGTGPFEVHVSKAFSLHDIAEAHRALEAHHLGKLALRLT